jgi:hypothetical protein
MNHPQGKIPVSRFRGDHFENLPLIGRPIAVLTDQRASARCSGPRSAPQGAGIYAIQIDTANNQYQPPTDEQSMTFGFAVWCTYLY